MSFDITQVCYAPRHEITHLNCAVRILAGAVRATAQAPAAPDGTELFRRTCAQCHMGGVNRAPDMDALRAMSPDRVLAAMETGPMISMATGSQRRRAARNRGGRHRQEAAQHARDRRRCPKRCAPAKGDAAPFNAGAGRRGMAGAARTRRTRGSRMQSSAGLTPRTCRS